MGLPLKPSASVRPAVVSQPCNDGKSESVSEYFNPTFKEWVDCVPYLIVQIVSNTHRARDEKWCMPGPRRDLSIAYHSEQFSRGRHMKSPD